MWPSNELGCLRSTAHVAARPHLLPATRLRLLSNSRVRQHGCSCGSSSDSYELEATQPRSQKPGPVRPVGSIHKTVRSILHRWQSRKFAQALAGSKTPVSSDSSYIPRDRQHMTAAKLGVLLSAAFLPGWGFADLGQNYVFMAGFWGWFLAQSCKIFTKRWRKGVWDLKAIVDSGGMPSSHSALCSAVTTSVAVEFGLSSSLFAVSVAFSLIVMYDAAGVRRHAGKQAEVLNILLEDLLEGHAVSETKLKEVLGHTPIQVCAGALLGILVGFFFPVPPAVIIA